MFGKQRAVRVQPTEAEPVEVQIMGDGFLDILDARDISRDGVGVVVPHGFKGCEIDEEVDLVITLPGQIPFLCKGLIVHRTEADREFFGVRFTWIHPAHRQQLDRYIALRRSGSRD